MDKTLNYVEIITRILCKVKVFFELLNFGLHHNIIMPVHYERREVRGVQCIVWLTKTTSSTTTSKNAIKKQKTKLGETNKNVPILDMCGTEYCDIILHSKHLNKWKQVILSELDGESESFDSGNNTKVVFRDEHTREELTVVHFYYSQEKLMIQPGKDNGAQLMKVLSNIPQLLSQVEADDEDNIASNSENLEEDNTTSENDEKVGTSSESEESMEEDEPRVILDPVLGYLSYGFISGSSASVKKAALGHFTEAKIKEGKKHLYKRCSELDLDVGDFQQRMSSKARGEGEAHLLDILSVMGKIDKMTNPPIFAIPAAMLRTIPRAHPEELNLFSVTDRIDIIEVTMRKMQESVLKTIEENNNLKEDVVALKQASIPAARAPPTPKASVPPKPQITVDRSFLDAARFTTEPNVTRSPPATNIMRSLAADNGMKSPPALASSTKRSTGKSREQTSSTSVTFKRQTSVDADSAGAEMTGFIQQRHQRKKVMIKGKGQAKSGLAGAPEPNRHLFVYRAAQETTVKTMTDHIKEHGIHVVGVECLSHNEAMFKSFKVTVPLSDFELILKEDVWPAGICVRKFFNPPEKWRTNSR